MDISFENVDGVNGLLTIKMGKADYEEQVEKTLKDYCKKAKMPGFRPGKVPMSIVKKQFGNEAKAEEINKILSGKLYDYIKENKINMLGEPLVHEGQQAPDFASQEDFEFVFDIAVAPEFKVELNQDDTVDYYDIQVTDEQVDNQVKMYANQLGKPEKVEAYEDKDILRGLLAELDENNQPKDGGVQVEKASLMPTYFKNKEVAKAFDGAKVNDVITFNVGEAYEGADAEIASLLKLKKEETEGHKGNYSFQVEEISRFTPAEINQALFDQIMGKDEVKSEEEFRGKIKDAMSKQYEADSDYRLLIDTRKYLINKVGQLTYPDSLLKRIIKANNPDKDDKFIEDNYAKSIEDLTWGLIKGQLVETYDVKVNDDDIKEMAQLATRMQFAQYGMTNVPTEYVDQYAEQMLKDKNQVNALVERCIDSKVTAAIKPVITLNHKSVSVEDFNKLFQ